MTTRALVTFTHAFMVGPSIGAADLPIKKDHPLRQELQGFILPQVQFYEATLEESIEFLHLKCLRLDRENLKQPGEPIRFVLIDPPAPGTLINLDLKNIPALEVIRYISLLSGMKFRIEEQAVLLMPLSDKRSGDSGPAHQNKAAERAKMRILPQVQFAAATLEEAVEFIRRGLRHCEEESPPINLVLKPSAKSDIPITLELKDVSVFEALTIIAKRSNYELTSDDHSLILAPR